MIIALEHTQSKTLLEKTLETAYLVNDYYIAFKQNKRLPTEPFPTLEEALRANRILKEYINKTNLSIKKGLKLVNSSLEEAEIIWTWQSLRGAAKFAAFK